MMKHMVKVVLSLFIAFGAVVAKADGFEAAEKVCKGLYLERDQTECLKTIGKSQYIEAAAANVCDSVYLDRDKIACLASIRDRKYTETAVKTCADMYLDRQKIECFSSAGRKATAADADAGNSIDAEFVRSNLKKIQLHLKNGETKKAERLVESLLETL